MDTASYLGGLITGEGCFCFSVHEKRHRRKVITPIFSIFMSDPETIEFAASALLDLGLPVYRQDRPQAASGIHCGIHISGLRRVRQYCELLIPHLTGQKRRAAEVTLKFIESRLGQPKGAPYTESEIELVRESRRINGQKNGRKNPL